MAAGPEKPVPCGGNHLGGGADLYRISSHAKYRPKGAKIMFLILLQRWSARHHEEPAGQLPAPGPFPAAHPRQDAIVVVVVLVVVLWLVAHGYSVATALAAVAGADALAAAITSRVAAQAGDT